MAHEEVEPRLRIGNLLVGNVVNVRDEENIASPTRPSKVKAPTVDEQMAAVKQRCAEEGHKLFVKQADNKEWSSATLCCGCGANEAGDLKRSFILKFLKELAERITHLENEGNLRPLKNTPEQVALVTAKSLCDAKRIETELRGVIADLTAKLNRSNLTAKDGEKLSVDLKEAYRCLASILAS